MNEFFAGFSLKEATNATIALLAVVDIVGSIPIMLSLRGKGMTINGFKVAGISLPILLMFLFFGSYILEAFRISSYEFTVGGSLLFMFMALELVLDVEIFKFRGESKEATIIPMVFPLVAGPGALTWLLAMRYQMALINILIALFLNMIWVIVVITSTDTIKRMLGDAGIYFLRRFFGVVLIAISVKMFSGSVVHLF